MHLKFKPNTIMKHTDDNTDGLVFEFGNRDENTIEMRVLSYRKKNQYTDNGCWDWHCCEDPKNMTFDEYYPVYKKLMNWRENDFILVPKLSVSPFKKYDISVLKNDTEYFECDIAEKPQYKRHIVVSSDRYINNTDGVDFDCYIGFYKAIWEHPLAFYGCDVWRGWEDHWEDEEKCFDINLSVDVSPYIHKQLNKINTNKQLQYKFYKWISIEVSLQDSAGINQLRNMHYLVWDFLAHAYNQNDYYITDFVTRHRIR